MRMTEAARWPGPRRGGPALALAVLAVAACSRPGPGAGGDAQSAAAPASPPAAAAPSAPPPAGAAPTPAADTQPASWPSRQELGEHALAVATYRPGDPAACGVQPPAAGGQGSVLVFFGCTPRSGPVLNAVPARRVEVPGGDAAAAALRALLAGPTAQEKSRGYLSNFSAETAGTGFTVRVLEGGLAVVDLDPSIRSRRFLFVSNMDAAQIVATLGQLPGVERVAILIGGRPLCKALGEC